MSKTNKLIIIGSGPSGYAAAIYAARAQLSPVLFSGEKSGGQLMLTTEVENYPGFKDGITGPELMMEMRAQAERFGTEIIDKFVSEVDFSEKKSFGVFVDESPSPSNSPSGRGREYRAEAVVLATGAEAIMLGIPGEDKYMGRGVSTCAVCDAAFFRDKRVFVVGGGDSAMEDTLALTKFARKITIIHRRDEFKASKIMQNRVLVDNRDKVEVWWNSAVEEVLGNEQKIEGIRVNRNGKPEEHEADGFFVAIGHKPATVFLKDQVELDGRGYVVTGLGLGAKGIGLASKRMDEHDLVKFPTMTSVEGVFAGGDNVDFRYRQAITAAGMGVQAALDAEWWLERG